MEDVRHVRGGQLQIMVAWREYRYVPLGIGKNPGTTIKSALGSMVD